MNRILALRQRAGLSQREFAKLFYVNQTAVSQWERGRTTPSPDTLVKIANHFGVSVDFLLKNEASMGNTLGSSIAILLGEEDEHVLTSNAPPVAEGAMRFREVLEEIGIIQAGDDLSDEQLAVVFDFIKQNSKYIAARVHEVENAKD